jgi:hypothetical protein
MRLAQYLWSLGSVLINVVIFIYVSLMRNAPVAVDERYAYINAKWDIFSIHWQFEFMLMTMIAIAAIYFAIHFKKISWVIISMGQLIVLLTYPLMLGGYRNTPVDLAELANQIAVVVFLFGNVVFFCGIFLLYLKDKLLNKWLSRLAMVLALVVVVVFGIAFFGFLTWKEAMVIGPLVNMVYLINAYYGLKIKPLEGAA